MSTIPTPCKNVSCQQLLSSSDVVHYGGLRQRQAVHKLVENTLPTVINIKWSRRFAVLHNGCLYLFKDEMSAHPLQSSTSLFGFTTCSCCSQEVSAHIPWPFKLSSELEARPRIYYFSSVSQNESLKWVEKIQQQMIAMNNSLTHVSTKGATFGLFPPDAPSAEVRPRDRASSDPAHMSTLNHIKRSLPPTPQTNHSTLHPSATEATGERKLNEVDEDDDFDDDYDELIDITKPFKAANLIVGLRRLLMPSRSDSLDVASKLSHSFSSPSSFYDDNTDDTPLTVEPGEHAAALYPVHEAPSPTSTLRPKPITAVKPCVSIKKTSPQPRRPTEEPDTSEQSSPDGSDTTFPRPVPRKRTFSDSHTCVEPGLVGAYWSKSANEGEELMKSLTNEGTFMIRESCERGQQTLMVRCENAVKKYRIYSDEDGKFYLDASNPRFTTRSALVTHYMTHCLPRGSLLLTKPYSTVMLSAVNASVARPDACH